MRKKDRSKNALKHGAFSRELILEKAKKNTSFCSLSSRRNIRLQDRAKSISSIISRRSSGGKDACRFIGRPSWRSVSGRSSARTSHTI